MEIKGCGGLALTVREALLCVAPQQNTEVTKQQHCNRIPPSWNQDMGGCKVKVQDTAGCKIMSEEQKPLPIHCAFSALGWNAHLSDYFPWETFIWKREGSKGLRHSRLKVLRKHFSPEFLFHCNCSVLQKRKKSWETPTGNQPYLLNPKRCQIMNRSSKKTKPAPKYRGER